MKRLPALLLALGALALAALPARAADDDAPWEASVRQAIQDQDTELTRARRRGSLQPVATQYASRVARQPTALNHFLLGRVLFFQGDREGASRHLRQSLSVDARFWFSRLRLAMLALESKNTRLAEQYLTEVLRVKPREPDALKLLAQMRLTAEDYDGALRALELLLSMDPTDREVRRSIVLCHIGREDWARALGELRALRGQEPNDAAVRWYYALALYETGDIQEAVRELEAYLLNLPKPDLRALDLLRVAYARLEDWKGVQRTIERILPHVPEGEFRTQIEDALRRLQAGETPGAGPEISPEQLEAQQQIKQLIDMALDPEDASKRREALQTWYQAAFPMLPSDLARRIVPDIEPDPVCRQWVLRIMGQLQNAALAHLAAYALYDPEISVQVVAAESLGDIGTPSGLLYLLPYFLGPEFEGPPGDEMVRRMNAARVALIRLTRRPDVAGGEGVWVEAPEIETMREDWRRWLAGPAGVQQRLEAIRDLAKHGERRPQYYLIEDVQDAQPAIAREAYKVLRGHADAFTPEDEPSPTARALWPRFPRFEDAALGDEGLAEMRRAVQAWWDQWLATNERNR